MKRLKTRLVGFLANDDFVLKQFKQFKHCSLCIASMPKRMPKRACMALMTFSSSSLKNAFRLGIWPLENPQAAGDSTAFSIPLVTVAPPAAAFRASATAFASASMRRSRAPRPCRYLSCGRGEMKG